MNVKIKKPKVSTTMNALSRKVGMAVCDYDMIEDGDRIIVAVSGGKDSTALLELLKYRKSFAPVDFELMAVHVDFGFLKKEKKVLEDYLKEQDIPYRIEKGDLSRTNRKESLNCFWCSWNRRKILFEVADKQDFNKIALGHHLDDIVETILLNLFYQGTISAMKPKQEFFEGKLTIIRPLSYIEEKDIERFAKTKNRQFPRCQCPNNDTSKRAVIKQLVRQLEKQAPHIKKNIFKSLKRIKEDYLL